MTPGPNGRSGQCGAAGDRLKAASNRERVLALANSSGIARLTVRRARVWRLVLLPAFVGYAALAAGTGFPKMYEAQSGRDAIQASRASGKPVMLYFTQTGCVWCDKVEHLLATSELRFTLVKSYHFVNVDIRHSGDGAVDGLKKMFKVRGTPAFAFLSPKGEPICMVYGNIRDDDELTLIRTTVQRLLAGAKPTVTTNGFPSCRGKASSDDSLITEVP